MTRDELESIKEDIMQIGIDKVRLEERCKSLERERDMWKSVAERAMGEWKPLGKTGDAPGGGVGTAQSEERR